MSMITLTQVSKVFEGKRTAKALENVSLQVDRGELVAIVGPSGSGKSTLLNLIGGLDRPTSGTIEIEGQNLADLPDDDLTRVRRDKIGFIFQFFNLLPTLNCLENVALPLHLRRWTRPKIQERAQRTSPAWFNSTIGWIIFRTNSPAASANAWRLRELCRSIRRFSSPMSRRATSTRPPARRSSSWFTNCISA